MLRLTKLSTLKSRNVTFKLSETSVLFRGYFPTSVSKEVGISVPMATCARLSLFQHLSHSKWGCEYGSILQPKLSAHCHGENRGLSGQQNVPGVRRARRAAEEERLPSAALKLVARWEKGMEGHGQVHCPYSPTCPQRSLNLHESPGIFFSILHTKTSLNRGASFLYVFFFPLETTKDKFLISQWLPCQNLSKCFKAWRRICQWNAGELWGGFFVCLLSQCFLLKVILRSKPVGCASIFRNHSFWGYFGWNY